MQASQSYAAANMTQTGGIQSMIQNPVGNQSNQNQMGRNQYGNNQPGQNQYGNNQGNNQMNNMAR